MFETTHASSRSSSTVTTPVSEPSTVFTQWGPQPALLVGLLSRAKSTMVGRHRRVMYSGPMRGCNAARHLSGTLHESVIQADAFCSGVVIAG